MPDPAELPTVADEVREHLGGLPESLERMARRQPFDIRYVDRLRWTREEIKDADPAARCGCARSDHWVTTRSCTPVR